MRQLSPDTPAMYGKGGAVVLSRLTDFSLKSEYSGPNLCPRPVPQGILEKVNLPCYV